MTTGPEQDYRLMTILNTALRLPEDERSGYLSIACQGNVELFQEVADAIEWEERMGNFLRSPLISLQGLERPFQAGEVIADRFEIIREIGEGGMGVVYEAFDRKRNQRIAIKSAKLGFRRLLTPELESALKVRHANICLVNEIHSASTEYGEVDFLTMEFLDGQTLSASLSSGALQYDEALDIARQLCSALTEAHLRGIIHRDLKSANVILCHSDDGTRAVITDFGLATEKTLDPRDLAGTPGYMAPELWRGERPSAASDIYALGVILHEMVTGVKPFTDQKTESRLTSLPVTPSTWTKGLDSRWDAAVLRCLNPSPAARPKDVKEVLALLERRQSAVRRRRVVLWAGLGAPAVVIAIAFSLRPPPRLTDKDTIVLADFDNRTGDTVFDGTLRQGLSSQLEQSPFLNLLSDQRIAQTLSLMTKSSDARLTPELARQVCQRTAGAASIEGSISSLGSQYVLGIKAVNCRNGDVLAEEQTTANSKEQVLQVLGQATRKMREKLGESLTSVQKYDAPPENVTTPSLEALQVYGLGLRAHIVKADYPLAIPLYQRAISLDPNFAMAYARQSACYSMLNQGFRAGESIRKAYRLRERVSELERLYIVSHYEHFVRNLDAARKTYELWTQIYPRDFTVLNDLGVLYSDLGDNEKALSLFQSSLKFASGSGGSSTAYKNLALTYLRLNRPDEAKAIAQEAQAQHLDSPRIHELLNNVAFLQHDMAALERETAMLLGKPVYEDRVLYSQSNTAAYAGKFAQARQLTRRAVSSAERADREDIAGFYQAVAAGRETLVNPALAKQQARAALARSNDSDVEARVAIALGLAGDEAQATRLAANLAKRFPEDTIVQSIYLPTIRALVALHVDRGKNAKQAIAALEEVSEYEFGSNLSLYPVYVRGEAYLAAEQGPAAVAEFQKILDHPGVVLNEPIGALAHLQLGRAYVLSGDTTKAKSAYKDFLTLWKDADPGIPILKQAKSEYSKLQ